MHGNNYYAHATLEGQPVGINDGVCLPCFPQPLSPFSARVVSKTANRSSENGTPPAPTEHPPSSEPALQKDMSSIANETVPSSAPILHDTAGWKALETFMMYV